MIETKIHESWKQVLLAIYMSANWRVIAKNRSSTDVFMHAVKQQVETHATVEKFIDGLCNALSLQLPQRVVDVVREGHVSFLKEHNDEALEYLRDATRVVLAEVVVTAQELWKQRKQKKKEETEETEDAVEVEETVEVEEEKDGGELEEIDTQEG